MKATSGTTLSVWADTAQIALRHKVDSDARANVCVVGAGIAGMTTAYLLARGGATIGGGAVRPRAAWWPCAESNGGGPAPARPGAGESTAPPWFPPPRPNRYGVVIPA